MLIDYNPYVAARLRKKEKRKLCPDWKMNKFLLLFYSPRQDLNLTTPCPLAPTTSLKQNTTWYIASYAA